MRSSWDHVAASKVDVPKEAYAIEFGMAEVRRHGKDITVVATMLMVHKALEAAAELAKEGIELEVIDPRTLVPLDVETILQSVMKTNRLIVAVEDHRTCGVSAEIAAIAAERAFAYLDAPPRRVASLDVPIPFAPIAEQHVIPNTGDIIKAARQLMKESGEWEESQYS